MTHPYQNIPYILQNPMLVPGFPRPPIPQPPQQQMNFPNNGEVFPGWPMNLPGGNSFPFLCNYLNQNGYPSQSIDQLVLMSNLLSQNCQFNQKMGDLNGFDPSNSFPPVNRLDENAKGQNVTNEREGKKIIFNPSILKKQNPKEIFIQPQGGYVISCRRLLQGYKNNTEWKKLEKESLMYSQFFT